VPAVIRLWDFRAMAICKEMPYMGTSLYRWMVKTGRHSEFPRATT